MRVAPNHCPTFLQHVGLLSDFTVILLVRGHVSSDFITQMVGAKRCLDRNTLNFCMTRQMCQKTGQVGRPFILILIHFCRHTEAIADPQRGQLTLEA